MNEVKDGVVYELIENISNRIKDFFPTVLDYYLPIFKDPALTEEDFLRERIHKFLTDYGMLKKYNDIISLSVAERNAIESLKKKRLYQSKKFEDDFKVEKLAFKNGNIKGIVSPLTPFCYIDLKVLELQTTVEVIEGQIEETFTTWRAKVVRKKNSKIEDYVFLCNYPYIGFYQQDKKRMKTFFDIDMDDIILLAANSLDVMSFAQIKPDSLIHGNIFSEKGFKDHAADIIALDDSVLKELGITEQNTKSVGYQYLLDQMMPGSTCLAIPGGGSLESRGSQVMLHVVTCVRNNFIINGNDSGEMTYPGKMTDVLRLMYPNQKTHFSKSQYEAGKNMLRLISTIRIYTMNANGIYTDSALITKFRCDSANNDSSMYYATLGPELAKDIVANRFTFILTSVLESLNDDVSKLLYQDFKKDRLYDLTNGKNVHFYHENLLYMVVKVSGRKTVRYKRYKAAFDVLIANKALISGYSEKENGFTLTWLPLTDSERRDILMPLPTDVEIVELIGQVN